MTSEELKTQIIKDKLTAWEQFRYLGIADEAQLAAAGYRGKTQAQAVLLAFTAACTRIETMIRKWEKANPDS